MVDNQASLTPAQIGRNSVSLFDSEDPRSLINLVSDTVRRAIQSAFEKEPLLFGMDERTLLKTLRAKKSTPTITDNRLRLNFWNQYDQTQARNAQEMNFSAIVAGICSRQFLYDHYLKRPENVAWMLCMPSSYETVLEEGLQFGLEQLRDVLALDANVYLTDADGKVLKDEDGEPTIIGFNMKLLEMKAKITEMIHVRLKGAVASKQLTVHASLGQVNKQTEALTMDGLQQQLLELEKREKAAEHTPGSDGVKDVEAEIVSEG
jgi:hypothetical protein